MSDWIGLAVYAAGWLFTYRALYRRIVESDDLMGDDAEGRLITSLLSAAASLLWPVVWVFLALHRFVRPTTTREREAAVQEREDAAVDREARIRRMERDLGIGPR